VRIGRRRLAVTGAALLSAAAALGFALRPPELAVPEPGGVLAHVTVVNPGAGRLVDHTLVVEGARIGSLRASRPDEPPGAWPGRFVLPGLIDLHVHHPPPFAFAERDLFALLFLAHGVTAVRDTGSIAGSLIPQRDRIARGERPGPRLFTCGPILDGEAALWPGSRVVVDRESARAAVDELAREGVDCIKVHNAILLEPYEAVAEAAAAHGLPLVAHLPVVVPLERLRGAELQHMMGLHYDWRDLPDERVAGYVRRSLEAGVRHTPTLVVFARAAQLDRLESLRGDPAAQLLPRYYRELLWDPAVDPYVGRLSPGAWTSLLPRVEAMQRTVRALEAAGVPVYAGTDALNPFVVPGASLHEELRLLAAAGLTPERVWRMATRDAGAALRVPGLGTLEPGAPADLLVFRDDPTRDLAALATLEAVVARGRLYPRAELDAAVARWRAHFESPLYDALSMSLARVLLAVARW
jgi:imidazolonepropionase-like amidohydrolase